MEALEHTPWTFWFATAVLVGLAAEASQNLRRPWASPLLVAYGTVGMWYHADFLYNSPASFAAEFTQQVLDGAFIQVSWFLICLRGAVGVFAGFGPPAGLAVPTPRSLAIRQERRLLAGLGVCWLGLAALGLARTGEVIALVCPPLSEAGSPWGRAGIGGTWDFLVSAAAYSHMAVCAMAGVLVADARVPKTRLQAAALWLSACPVFVFGRARSGVIGILLPGVIAYMISGRVPVTRKAYVATATFLLLSSWFGFVQNNRNSNFSVLRGEATDSGDVSSQHLGLDMFRELCYINSFVVAGSYQVNWGERYFAEAVAVIPRAVWRDKPGIGIDYSIARGFGGTGQDHGVSTTVATGMIGQGVVNFGRVLGPAAAAVLCAAWVRVLSHFWTQRSNVLRMPLCMLGLGLTINMGRDITLLVLFPFVFAYIGIRVYERYSIQPSLAAPAAGCVVL